MHIVAKTLDDLLLEVYPAIRDSGTPVKSTKGANYELMGVLLELSNPLARLSRTESRSILFSALGEFIWYLTGSNDVEFIAHYIPNYKKFKELDGTVHGAYGPRLMNMRGEFNQLANVISVLKDKPSSRQAVIQLFDAADIVQNKTSNTGNESRYKNDIPCTLTIQFFIRNRKLNMIVNMRSNDAYIGLPHDIFVFTMLQEYMACKLDVELGSYKHFVGSLHLYKEHIEKVNWFIKEGYQSTKAIMPRMPAFSLDENLKSLLLEEQKIRNGEYIHSNGEQTLDTYWYDFVLLLIIFMESKNLNENSLTKLSKVKLKIANKAFYSIVDRKIEKCKKKLSLSTNKIKD